jgi:succinate dehydrogenase hydrophobic anchor subunit
MTYDGHYYDQHHHYSQNNFHNNLFRGTIAVSTLGASITFQVVIQQIEADVNVSTHHTFHRKTARTFLAIAWLLFTIALGTAGLAAIVMALREDLGRTGRGTYERAASAMSGILLALLLAAFLFCSLAVTAYCEGAGWTGVGMSVVFLALALCIWLFHMMYVLPVVTLDVLLPEASHANAHVQIQAQRRSQTK